MTGGRLMQVWRYPVKSMLGEQLPAALVDSAGVAGDRRFALVHRETGRVASAKDPRRWRALLTLQAAAGGDSRDTQAPGGDPLGRSAGQGPVAITLPDGRTLSSLDADVDDVLSALLGVPVALVDTPPGGATLDRARPEAVLAEGVTASVPIDVSTLGAAAPGTFFDFAPIHLVTTATLDRLAAEVPAGPVPAERYRPNLVVAVPGAGFVENGWVGRHLRIGPDLVLRVLAPTPRCAVPTLAHGSLPRQPDALRVPARLNRIEPLPGLGRQPCVGAYAHVVTPGRIEVDDPVEVD